MENKVIKNYLYNLIYQLLIIIIPIITTPYISRVLGADRIGNYNYTNSIVQYFILFGCIGLNLYGQREIAYHQHEKDKRTKVFFELVFIRVVTLVISLILYFFVFFQDGNYKLLFMIQSIEIVASIFDVSWFFQGIEDFKKTVVRNIIVRLFLVLFMFTCVKTKSDIYIYVLGCSGSLLIGNISLWLYLPKFVNKVKFNELNILRHLKPCILLFVPQIATSLYTMLDKTMIGLLTDNNAEVAFYTQSQMIIKTVLTVITSLSTAMMPRMANLFQLNKQKEIRNSIYASLKFVLLLSLPFVFGIIGVSAGFVEWFFGEGFEKVCPNLIIISPIIVFIGLTQVIGNQFLLPVGRQREYSISVIFGSVINFILNMLLIPVFMSLGAAIATVAAEFGVFVVQIYYTRKDFEIGYILKNLAKYLIYSVIMGIIVLLVSFNLPHTIMATIIEMIIGILVYVMILIITKDDFLNNVLDYIRKDK